MNIIKKTNGKKTEAVGILMVALQIITMLKPNLIPSNLENSLEIIISSGVLTTLSHRVWRNRKEIITYIKNKLKSLKRLKND